MSKEIQLPGGDDPRIQRQLEEQRILAKIPKEAYITAICECGCDVFEQAANIAYYPGGIWHAKRVVLPRLDWFCWSCGKRLQFKKPGEQEKPKE